MTRQADVAIVGDGVMGSSIAYFLTADPTTTTAQNASGNSQTTRIRHHAFIGMKR